MEPLPRPADGDQSRGPRLLAMWWAELSICIVMVAMRFYSRYKLKNFGMDDWLMLTALVRKWKYCMLESPSHNMDPSGSLRLYDSCRAFRC